MLTDPGATPEYPAPLDIPLRELRYCTYCDQWKPPRTHHCSVCNKCYHKMDHHCPWVNNCVAARNQKFFMLFNLYTCLAAGLGLLIILICCTNFVYTKEKWSISFFNLIVGSFAFIECLLFMIFTGDFLKEQYFMVKDNQTTVEMYQNRWGEPLSFTQSLTQVLGKNKWLWFVPVLSESKIDFLELSYTKEQRNEILKNILNSQEKLQLLDHKYI